MGMIVLKKMEKLAHKCFDGDLTMPKVNFWMIGTICLLTGIVYGLRVAPLTHGVKLAIGSNNGDNRNCIWQKRDEEDAGDLGNA